uniref:Uncharacterized protein n=1 Tax=Cacopsylla melanoneura TaxID=428564 RepID=A0A8D8YKX4_9HEMI
MVCDCRKALAWIIPVTTGVENCQVKFNLQSMMFVMVTLAVLVALLVVVWQLLEACRWRKGREMVLLASPPERRVVRERLRVVQICGENLDRLSLRIVIEPRETMEFLGTLLPLDRLSTKTVRIGRTHPVLRSLRQDLSTPLSS